ncbi:MAG: hypothetical protein E7616_04670 [Ruminococcaceae bacterium]|nr:hypothetical protein [Oscillospiraceae bacterium]
MRIIDFIFGRITFSFAEETKFDLFDVLRHSGANYESIKRKDGQMRISCPKRDGERLKILFKKYTIPFTVQKEQGMFLLFRRTKKRPGLYLGLILFFALLMLSTQFVFDIRIEGNEILTDGEILSELAAQGFTSGSYLPPIDMEVLCNRVVLHSEKISWISVNMLGTVACVQVKERSEKTELPPKEGLSCLVASRDGVIVGFDCTTGTAAVNVGQTVRKGQMLVSGVTDTELGSYYGSSAGAVRARTERAFSITIPKTEELTVGYDRRVMQKSIIFFGKTIKLFTKGGNLPSTCDTIKTESKQASLSPSLLLPIFVRTVYSETPIYEQVTHSEEEARRLAMEKLSGEIEALSQCRILSTSSNWQESEGGYTLTVKMTCIENIAEKVTIEIN